VELAVWKKGSSMQFDVIDYGKALDSERLNSIFDGSDSYTGNENSDFFKGIGIGLSICKTIVTSHQGSISAKNHGSGAIFSFTLPMHP